MLNFLTRVPLVAISIISSSREDIDCLSMMVIQEILNNLIKFQKSISSSHPNDLNFKLILMNIIRNLIKEKITNNFQNRQDIYKLIIKCLNVENFKKNS